MPQLAENVLAKIHSATNINNKNNKNNKTTTTLCRPVNKAVGEDPTSSSFGLASLSASPEGSQQYPQPRLLDLKVSSELPDRWKICKWDLFRNEGRLKLNCNIIRFDNTAQRIVANLNSPHDRVWRKVPDEDKNNPHWALVRQELKLWRSTYGRTIRDFMVSKFYLPNKQGSVEIVAFMHESIDEYHIRMIYKAQMYDYIIQKSSYDSLSEKQIQGNQIASLCVTRQQSTPFVDLDELGI